MRLLLLLLQLQLLLLLLLLCVYTSQAPIFSLQDLEAEDLSSGCRPSNASSSFPLCSGRGDCLCGECRCKDLRENGMVISGKYCQEVREDA